MQLQANSDRPLKSGGSHAPGALACQQLEQCPVTAIGRMAVRTGAEVRGHSLSLFRPELLVQIFPEPNQYVLTLHTAYPLATSLLVPVGNRTAGPVTWFLQIQAGAPDRWEAV